MYPIMLNKRQIKIHRHLLQSFCFTHYKYHFFVLVSALFFIHYSVISQNIDTIEVIQWPSSYKAYTESLNGANAALSTREPSSQKTTLLVNKIKVKRVKGTPLTFVGESSPKSKVILSFSKLDVTKHKINYETSRVNGKIAYGIHPLIDSLAYLDKVEFDYNNKTYSDSPNNRAFYFNYNLDIKIYEIIDKGVFIICLSGGDGAGGYENLLFYRNGEYLTDFYYELPYGYLTEFGKDFFNCNDKEGCIYSFRFPEQKE